LLYTGANVAVIPEQMLFLIFFLSSIRARAKVFKSISLLRSMDKVYCDVNARARARENMTTTTILYNVVV